MEAEAVDQRILAAKSDFAEAVIGVSVKNVVECSCVGVRTSVSGHSRVPDMPAPFEIDKAIVDNAGETNVQYLCDWRSVSSALEAWGATTASTAGGQRT